MASNRGPGRLLARHFFWRFLDNDLISPDSDVHEMAALGLAFLAVPSLLGTALFLFVYANPFATPYHRLVVALPHKYMYEAWSMLVMALVTLVEWDALSLDARDYAVLGPLPVRPRALLAAKLLALVGFVTAVVVAVNAVPTIFFPLISVSSTGLSLPLFQAARMVAGHAVSVVGAALFGFLAVLALRGFLLAVLGARWFRRVTLPVQFLVAVGLVLAFVSLPQNPADGGRAVRWSPPMWFVGVYETIGGATMFEPAVTKWVGEGADAVHKWQVKRELRARSVYLGYQPLFSDLARTAGLALAIAAVLGLSLYFAAHVRHAVHLRQAASLQPSGAPRPIRRRVAALLRRVAVRDPLAQATFFFTLQALARSTRHKLYLATYVGAGVLVSYLTLAPYLVRRPASLFTSPCVTTISMQLVLSFFLVVGLRAIFTIPAELRANWLFRLTVTGDPHRYLAGVRRAAAAVVLPLLVALFPLHVAWWGVASALQHAGFGVLWAAVLLEVLMLNLEKLPFTCSKVPGQGGIRVFWPAYLAAFAVYVYWFARREEAVLVFGASPWTLAVALLAALAGLRGYRRQRSARTAGFVFAELPDTVPLTLEL